METGLHNTIVQISAKWNILLSSLLAKFSSLMQVFTLSFRAITNLLCFRADWCPRWNNTEFMWWETSNMAPRTIVVCFSLLPWFSWSSIQKIIPMRLLQDQHSFFCIRIPILPLPQRPVEYSCSDLLEKWESSAISTILDYKVWWAQQSSEELLTLWESNAKQCFIKEYTLTPLH